MVFFYTIEFIFLYKIRNDLNIYKSAALKSTFIVEIINHKKSNILVVVFTDILLWTFKIMDLRLSWTLNFLIIILMNYCTSFPQKTNLLLFLDFNVNLLKYDNHHPTNEFLDSLSSHLVLPYITQPTRTRDSIKTLTDHIFSNALIGNTVSGNLIIDISDHTPQLLPIVVFGMNCCQLCYHN